MTHAHFADPLNPMHMFLDLFIRLGEAIITAEEDGEQEVIIRSEELNVSIQNAARCFRAMKIEDPIVAAAVQNLASRLQGVEPQGIFIQSDMLQKFEESIAKRQAANEAARLKERASFEQLKSEMFATKEYTMQQIMDMMGGK